MLQLWKKKMAHTLRIRGAVEERRKAGFKSATTKEKASSRIEAHTEKVGEQRAQKINQIRRTCRQNQGKLPFHKVT